MRTKKRGVDRLLAFRICRYAPVYTYSNLPALLPQGTSRASLRGRMTGVDSRRTTPAVIRGSESPPDSHSLPLLHQLPSPIPRKNTPENRGYFHMVRMTGRREKNSG